MNQKDRNKVLIKEKCIQEMNLRTERYRRAMPFFFHLFDRQLSRKMAVHQLEIMLNCATQYGQCSLTEIIDKSINKYIANDLSYKYYDRSHPLYQDLQNILIEWFRSRIITFGELLKGEGNNYDELIKGRFKTRDEARKILAKGIEVAAQAIRLIESTPQLLRLPFGIGRYRVIDFLKEELQYSRQQLSEDLNRIYS